MKFAAIKRQVKQYAVQRMCCWLDVSRSGFYKWARLQSKPKSAPKFDLEAEIEAIYNEHKGRYGSPRVHRELARRKFFVGKRRVERIMRERGFVGRTRRRFVVTTVTDDKAIFADNVLERDFSTTGPNQKWVSDITYVDTDEGWLYLASVQDLYSGRIIGWAAAETMETDLCLQALQMATELRKPMPGLIHHSDRGTQYTSRIYRRALESHGIICSMSRKGQCWDNATAESFFGRFKEELCPVKRWPTKSEAVVAIKEYIDSYYNVKRIKLRLGNLSPVEYELQHGLSQKAA